MFQVDLEITETDPDAIDPDAETVYKVEVTNLPSFYLLLPSEECIGIGDQLRDVRLPLGDWLMEWDLHSPGVIDQLYDAIPELEPDE